jgi:uncharacterized protein (DUF1501 family)
MNSSRRLFLRRSTLAMAGFGVAPLWLRRALYAADAPAPRKKILVAVFQRGAADGLNIVVPHGDSRYYELRPTISVPRPSRRAGPAEDATIDLDGFFGLHPALAPLKPIWDSGHLAVVHAAGSPDPTRSHFDAQDFMESGTPGRKTTPDGWMNRALVPGPPPVSPVRAVSMGPLLSRAMRGPHPALAVQNLADFQVRNPDAARSFEALYTDSSDHALSAAARETFEAVSLLRDVEKRPYQPAPGANYPEGRFGQSLQQIAQLIKADVGLELAFADVGGWDHHVNEVGARASEGQLNGRLTEFGQSLAAFWNDLEDRRNDVALVTMSEFGRTAHENGDRGTDHGHANCMFVMGGSVRGRKVYGDWPGLGPEQLYEGRDLALTTDFRDVLGELVTRQSGNRDLRQVFPGYNPRFRGVVQG